MARRQRPAPQVSNGSAPAAVVPVNLAEMDLTSSVAVSSISTNIAIQSTTTDLVGVPIISGNGNTYSQLTFPLSNNLRCRAQQIKALTELEMKISPDKLRPYTFEWKDESWIPIFPGFWKPTDGTALSLNDIWTEHEHGLGHWMSVRQLNENWGARWKRNEGGIKVEYSRRNKVVTLIKTLCERISSWSPDDALTYLGKNHPIDPQSSYRYLHTSRALMEHLQKKGVLEDFVSGIVKDVLNSDPSS